jgi:hypothetical protein
MHSPRLAYIQNLKALLGSANWQHHAYQDNHVAFIHLSRGITSSMAVHHVIPSDAAARFQSGTEAAAIFTQQIANRSIKSDRLQLNQAKPHFNDKAPMQVPAQISPNLKFKTNCKPPIDIPGRCFAEARVKYKVG